MSLTDTLKAIATVTQRVMTTGDPLRHLLTRDLAETSGLHPTSVQRLTDLWARAWQEPGLQRCVDRAGLRHCAWQPLGTVAIVAPGNLFVATWQAMLEALLAGNRLRVRPASGDPLAAERLRDAVAIVAPELAQTIEIDPFSRGDVARWQRFLQQTQALVVLGGDSAVAAVVQRAGEAGYTGRIRGHGDLQSCALIDTEVFADPQAFTSFLPGLAHDALLADGRGCMSLRAIHVLGRHDPAIWRARHQQLAQVMAEVAVQLPRGRMDSAELASVHLQAEAWSFQAAQTPDRTWLHVGPDFWLASQVSVPQSLPVSRSLGPGSRGLLMQGVAELADWTRYLGNARGRLSVVAVAGRVPRDVCDSLGIIRTCAPGEMQAPPADRAPDGHLPLVELVRWLDR